MLSELLVIAEGITLVNRGHGAPYSTGLALWIQGLSVCQGPGRDGMTAIKGARQAGSEPYWTAFRAACEQEGIDDVTFLSPWADRQALDPGGGFGRVRLPMPQFGQRDAPDLLTKPRLPGGGRSRREMDGWPRWRGRPNR